MNRQHFTMNPATPHPDSDPEPTPWPLIDSIIHAVKVLRDPTADQWTRTRAADELIFSFEAQDKDPPAMFKALQTIHANAAESPEWIRARIDEAMKGKP